MLGEFQHPWHQLPDYPIHLRVFITRMQRRELHRDTGCRKNIVTRGARRRADFADRRVVGFEIPACIGLGERRLTEHIERVAVGLVALRDRALQCFLYRAAHDELVPHDAHRLAHCRTNNRFTGATRDLGEHLRRVHARRFVDLQQLAGQHEAPGRRVDEQRLAGAEMLFPSCSRNLVGNQAVGGIGVGYAQQGLRDAHEQYALLRRQIVLLQERVYTSFPCLVLAHRCHQLRGGIADPGARRLTRIGDLPEIIDEILFVGEVARIDVGYRARTGKRLPRK